MATTRIDETTLAKLREIAREHHETLTTTLAKAVEAYRRKLFMDEANASVARLRADPVAWNEYWDEFKEWEEAGLRELNAKEPPYDFGDDERVRVAG